MTIASNVQKHMTESSWIRRMFELGIALKNERGEENVFDLSLGNPVMEPPQEFNDELKDNIDLLVIGVSSKGIDWIGDEISKFYNDKTDILLLTKGLTIIENKFETLAEKLSNILKTKGINNPKISAVGGPCLANGLVNRINSSVVLANEDGGEGSVCLADGCYDVNMADTWGDARRMVLAAEKNSVQLTFNHQRRFGKPFSMAKDLLKSGQIGDLLRLEAACGDIYDYGTHYIDMFGFYNQDLPAKWVQGQIDYRTKNLVFGSPEKLRSILIAFPSPRRLFISLKIPFNLSHSLYSNHLKNSSLNEYGKPISR